MTRRAIYARPYSVVCAMAAAATPGDVLHAFAIDLIQSTDAAEALHTPGADLAAARKVAEALPNVELHEVLVTGADVVAALRDAICAVETDDVVRRHRISDPRLCISELSNQGTPQVRRETLLRV